MKFRQYFKFDYKASLFFILNKRVDLQLIYLMCLMEDIEEK